jgi:hypothetical protein
MIEGSHSCYLWIYKNLSKEANIFNLNRREFRYYELTSGLNNHEGSLENFVHNGQWQKRAVDALRSLDVDIHIKDVLTDDDWYDYRQQYGVY